MALIQQNDYSKDFKNYKVQNLTYQSKSTWKRKYHASNLMEKIQKIENKKKKKNTKFTNFNTIQKTKEGKNRKELPNE